MKLSLRQLQPADITTITHYWLTSDAAFLEGMGVDLTKLPSPEEWSQMLTEQINTPLAQKQSYCLIWEVDGNAVGHSNVNKIVWGEEAYLHLHLWFPEGRKSGFGTELLKRTLPHFFLDLHLQRIYCEPYALNPAPNKTLEKVGFHLEKEYITTPGWINFEQPVKRWVMHRVQFEALYGPLQDLPVPTA
ncbi:GNAT family N-acetyltransferase [Rufibacter glacialis]|uniref:GNAT family N-acetyltransferase n=1 Tax=Rufibacter glacialis TaxID=1259555 RepID=A0A5M8QDV0_9BACT|nr:GNAT family protein [Rufibacter glacialis]KAA6434225.1 GNAT family N-acetyltransferase [Rufibacter glacialis]GGK67911.1 hypothetical protein GCM10011405_14830 [Rufibacter glacialis]